MTLSLVRHAHPDVVEPKIEGVVVLRNELTVSTNDLLDADIEEVVKRVNVLLDQASETEEGRDKLPLILNLLDGLTHLGLVVELMEIVSMGGIFL
jgi:hypothetical protein